MKKLLQVLCIVALSVAGMAYGQEAITSLRPGRTTSIALAKVPVSHTGATTPMCTLTSVRECTIKNLSPVRLCLKFTATDTDCSGVTIVDGCASEVNITIVPVGESFFVVLDQEKDSNMCGKLEASSANDCDASPNSNDCVYATEAR